jgi:hypothetical protein
MATLCEGSTASIVVCETAGIIGLIKGPWVEKRYARRIGQAHRKQEKESHRNIDYHLRDCALKAPLLAYTDAYIMERVDTSRPLWEEKEVSDQHIDILAQGLTHLLWEGYEMRDVEVYIQPDGSLRMLDFGQVTKSGTPPTLRLLSASVVPASEVERLEAAWKVKMSPPAVQKDPCTRGCCCTCCMKCSRQMCHGRCGTVRKLKTLHELFNLKGDDLLMKKCTRQEYSDSGILRTHVDRHLRWHHHTWYSGSHQMPDGTYAYLYLTGGGSEGEKPVYQTQAWKDWVVAYRAEFWKAHFYGNDYQPLCAKDCEFRLPHCDCGELFHGMKLVGGNLVPDVETTVCSGHPACVQEMMAEVASWKAADDDDEDEVEQLSRLRRP